jgi:hypothetical protein
MSHPDIPLYGLRGRCCETGILILMTVSVSSLTHREPRLKGTVGTRAMTSRSLREAVGMQSASFTCSTRRGVSGAGRRSSSVVVQRAQASPGYGQHWAEQSGHQNEGQALNTSNATGRPTAAAPTRRGHRERGPMLLCVKAPARPSTSRGEATRELGSWSRRWSARAERRRPAERGARVDVRRGVCEVVSAKGRHNPVECRSGHGRERHR